MDKTYFFLAFLIGFFVFAIFGFKQAVDETFESQYLKEFFFSEVHLGLYNDSSFYLRYSNIPLYFDVDEDKAMIFDSQVRINQGGTSTNRKIAHFLEKTELGIYAVGSLGASIGVRSFDIKQKDAYVKFIRSKKGRGSLLGFVLGIASGYKVGYWVGSKCMTPTDTSPLMADIVSSVDQWKEAEKYLYSKMLLVAAEELSIKNNISFEEQLLKLRRECNPSDDVTSSDFLKLSNISKGVEAIFIISKDVEVELINSTDDYPTF